MLYKGKNPREKGFPLGENDLQNGVPNVLGDRAKLDTLNSQN
jgi:hypothetical protein